MFYKKGVLKNFAKFTGKHLCHSLYFNKVARPQAYKTALDDSFYIFKIREQFFSGSASGWLLLYIYKDMFWAFEYASDSMLLFQIVTCRVIRFLSYYNVQFSLIRFKSNNKNQNLNSAKCFYNNSILNTNILIDTIENSLTSKLLLFTSEFFKK